MFLDNKYAKYYFSIIHSAPLLADTDYCEKHHIIPVSLGGTDSPDNLVKLSARTHYLCHLLLTKMTVGAAKQKMAYALSLFNTGCKNLSRLKPNSRWYEYSRKLLSEVKKGKPASKACLDAVSKAKKGVPISEEQKRKMSLALKKKRHFFAVSPSDNYITGSDLEAFCLSENISYNTIRNKSYPFVITAGKNKGWIFSDLEIHDFAQIRNSALQSASKNRTAGIKLQWSDERRDGVSRLMTSIYSTPARKQQQRDNTRYEVVLKSPDGEILTFNSLSDVKIIGPVSTIQLSAIGRQIKVGKWAGWTKLKYAKAK